jgi:PIN domain nuclease of toxin-antitoxin system
MRLLADSHVALWWLEGNDSLGDSCRVRIDRADEVFFSAATVWELGIKRALAKLSFPDGLVDSLVDSGFVEMPISAAHADRAASLPPHHRDPFDRMLIAQAQLESLTLVTADRAMEPYDVATIDARH